MAFHIDFLTAMMMRVQILIIKIHFLPMTAHTNHAHINTYPNAYTYAYANLHSHTNEPKSVYVYCIHSPEPFKLVLHGTVFLCECSSRNLG